jgi:hypothetical protein
MGVVMIDNVGCAFFAGFFLIFRGATWSEDLSGLGGGVGGEGLLGDGLSLAPSVNRSILSSLTSSIREALRRWCAVVGGA